MPGSAALVSCVERALRSLLAISDVAGIAALIAREIESEYAGLAIYFPSSRQRELRDALIAAEHQQGASIRLLASRYRLSPRRIRGIVKKRGKFFNRKFPRQQPTLDANKRR